MAIKWSEMQIIKCGIILSLLVIQLDAIDPVTVGIGVGAVAAAAGGIFTFVKCKFEECCSDSWVRTSPEILQALEKSLTTQLHGQPFVNQIVFKAIKKHMMDKNPNKALVMSFHGGSGTGKTYVSEIIAKAIFQLGINSQYFVRIGGRDKLVRRKDPVIVQKYQEFLKETVVNKLKACKRSIFVIDEIDDIDHGVLDILTPFLDYGQYKVDGTEKHFSTFIFLGNTGSQRIVETLTSHWQAGKSRSELVLKDMETMINKESFNEEGGFKGSEIMHKGLIDHYVAFLPLEKKHVRMCIQDHIRTKYGKPREDFVDRVVEEIEYFPADSQVYAITGCKRVQKKVDVLWED